MRKIKTKKGAMELSISTVVIIVLAMSMLILGIVLVRKIMCSGIQLTDDIDKETRKQIIDIFGSQEYGIECVGEIIDKTLGSGGKRSIVCASNFEASEQVEMRYVSSVLVKGRIPGETVGRELSDNFLLKKQYPAGTRPSGKDDFKIAQIDIPSDIDTSKISLTFDEYRGGTKVETHYIDFDLRKVSPLTATMC